MTSERTYAPCGKCYTTTREDGLVAVYQDEKCQMHSDETELCLPAVEMAEDTVTCSYCHVVMNRSDNCRHDCPESREAERRTTAARIILPSLRQLTGKQYPHLEKELKNLSAEALRDLGRVLADAQSEVSRAKRTAITQPWRRS